MNDQAKRWTACGDVVRRDGGDVAGCAGDSHAATRLAACADLLRGVGDLSAVAVMAWVPCSERMPPAETDTCSVEVLLTDGEHIGQGYLDLEPERRGKGKCHTIRAVTEFSHWMPMPVPPKGGA